MRMRLGAIIRAAAAKFKVRDALRRWGFRFFLRHRMAREKKRYELREVDDTNVEKASSYIRLEKDYGESEEDLHIEILEKKKVPIVVEKLHMPATEDVQKRSHQPGIDAILDPAAESAKELEQNWGAESSASSGIPWGWFVLLGLVLSAALLWSLKNVEKSETKAVKIEQSANTTLTIDETSEREATLLIESMEKTIHQYYKADTIVDRLKLVRHPERVKALMENYYGEQQFSLASDSLDDILSLQPITLERSAAFWIGSLLLENGKKQDLILEVLESGEVKIDWETLVCYQPMKWEDFIAQRPEGKSIDWRVYIEPDNLFSHEFADSSRWNCFRVSTLNSDEILFGYSEVDSAISKSILTQFKQNDGQPLSLIIRLRIPDGLKSHQGAVIEKVVSNNWIFVEDPSITSP